MTTLIEARPFGRPGSHPIIATVQHRLQGLARQYRRFRENGRKRRNLKRMADLSDHILRDIGIERSDLTSVIHNCRSERRPAWGGGHDGS